ncbi:MAG: hypothetical protein KatS3mg028_1063 [Bacteroidia bacterium]|nr:MAG: hypothetical protein KatS3mg028_1063 [Bacteroidia bacterium]
MGTIYYNNKLLISIVSIVLSIITLMPSCKKDIKIERKNITASNTCNSNNNVHILIQQQWEWMYTRNIWQQIIITPSLAGYSRQLIFHQDSIFIYKNNQIDAICSYTLTYKVFSNQDSSLYIQYNPEPLVKEKGKYIRKLTCDSLIFDDSMIDGDIHVYIKK